MFQPKTLQQSIMPILMANLILGMGIWTSKRGRILNMVYSLICLVTYCVMVKLSMDYLYLYSMDKASSFGDMTFQAIFYANLCMMLCLIPCAWLRRKHMKAAMMRIMMCEKTMDQMGLEKNYRKLYLRQLYYLLIVIVTFTLFVLVNYGTFKEETPGHIRLFVLIGGTYPVALLYISDVSFLHWVSYSKTRFEQLNSVLQRMLTTTPDSPQHKRVLKMKDEWNKTFITSGSQQDRRAKENTDMMRAVKQVHLELIKSTRSTNEAYGIQILLSMTVSFVFITSLLYYAYSIYWLPDLSSAEFRKEMIPVVGWVLFYASKVLVINHMCSLATIEAANTGDIICELYEPSTSKEFRAEIRDFTLQLIQNPLIFTACGFFNLDHTFIHGVIGSVTTYLVILIQVGDLPTGKDTNSTNSMNSSIKYGANYTISDMFTTAAYL